MWQWYLLFLTHSIFGVILVIFMQKIRQIKKQMDEITEEVRNYIHFVIEDEKEEKERDDKKKNDEEQSSLIQAVLGDIFP